MFEKKINNTLRNPIFVSKLKANWSVCIRSGTLYPNITHIKSSYRGKTWYPTATTGLRICLKIK